MGAPKISSQNHQLAYDFYRSLSKSVWQDRDVDELESAGFSGVEKWDASIWIGHSLLARIAHEASYEDFCGFLDSGETPSVKLSKNELKLLKGGFDPALLLQMAFPGGRVEYWQPIETNDPRKWQPYPPSQPGKGFPNSTVDWGNKKQRERYTWKPVGPKKR